MGTSDVNGPTNFADPLRFFSRVLVWLYTRWVRVMYPFASIGRKVSFHYTSDLRNTGLIELGDFVAIHKDVWLHAHQPNTEDDRASLNPIITIGDRSSIARRCHISSKNRIIIENDVMFAAGVLVQDNGHNFSQVGVPIRDQGVIEGGTIRIGQGSWIGQNAAIICDRGELSLGRNCVVAANSVVTRSAGDYSVISGNPARVVKQYDPSKGAWTLGSITAAGTPAKESAASTKSTADQPLRQGGNSQLSRR